MRCSTILCQVVWALRRQRVLQFSGELPEDEGDDGEAGCTHGLPGVAAERGAAGGLATGLSIAERTRQWKLQQRQKQHQQQPPLGDSAEQPMQQHDKQTAVQQGPGASMAEAQGSKQSLGFQGFAAARLPRGTWSKRRRSFGAQQDAACTPMAELPAQQEPSQIGQLATRTLGSGKKEPAQPGESLQQKRARRGEGFS
jgi:hypothetical protein